MPATAVLLPGRDKSLRNRHPWVFSGAIAGLSGAPVPGDAVDILSSDGRLLGRGFYNPASQITLRVVSWGDDPVPGPAEWRALTSRALEHRVRLGMKGAGRACRLVHSEADGFPGLIADWYSGVLVVQLMSLCLDRRRDEILQALVDVISPDTVWERSEGEGRKLEGLDQRSGLLHGQEPPRHVEIGEEGLRLLVDVRSGHKTGFYLDQARNRSRSAVYLQGRSVLNCYSYTGAFAMHALRAGATHVENVDSSAPSLDLLRLNADLNGFDMPPGDCVCGDVPAVLRAARDGGRRFGAVVLDPPRFVHGQNNLERGLRAYKDINLVAIQVVEPGGILVTFSCSGLVGPELFQKVVFGASVDASRDVRIVERLDQAPDHPVLLSLPQGSYLKGLVCRVD
jgi:23S rRNA (cytosine1962-C5)-methyltransferase